MHLHVLQTLNCLRFNELKRFQNEFILVNIDNAEKTSNSCLNKNNVLSNRFQMIIEKENYTKSLNKNIIDYKNNLNNNREYNYCVMKYICKNIL
jgi:hypothetical protein